MISPDFVRQYVALIERPIQTRIDMEMVRIVDYHQECPPTTMFTDEQLREIHPTCNVVRDVYAFVRDNQKLFAK